MPLLLPSDLARESSAALAKMADTPDDKMTRYHHLVLLVFRLELTKTISCLTSDAIRVYVGPKAKRYSVHEALLTRYGWFREKIYDSSDVSSQGSITLHTEDPKVFELLISWLYRKRLKAISTTDAKVAREEVTLYVDLYLRACVWEMHELQNALMDRLKAGPTCAYGFLPLALIKKIYQNTAPQSPLRSYIVDSFIYRGVKGDEDAEFADLSDTCKKFNHRLALNIQLKAGNHDFVLDCYEALLQLCAKSSVRDSDRRPGYVLS